MKSATPVLRFVHLAAAAFVLATLASPAAAVPVFSRKYKTSCQTCHVIFPKLNPFGEAFRLNGYRLPGETDAQVKQTPVSLGSDAYEKIWPAAVYPATLPGNAPLALNVKLANLYASSHDDEGRQIVHNDFQFPQEVNLFAAGTVGKTFSFFGEIAYGELPDGGTEVEIEHARIDVISAFGPEHLFNFRVGKLAPGIFAGFQEMWLMTDNGVDALFGYAPVNLNGGTGFEGGGVGLPAHARAIEMYGVAAHRFFYTVGVANPIGPGGPGDTFGSNSRKDLYARVDYKFGGMGLDGDTTGVSVPDENWRETSFRVGVFGYTGDGTDIDIPITGPDGTEFNMQDLRYERVGVYGSLMLGDLNLFGAAVHGTDKLLVREAETGEDISTTKKTYDAWFAQADWVITPPFQVSVRYENLRPADETVRTSQVLNANVSFLARANVKLMLEYRRDLHDSQSYTLATVLRMAF